MNATILVVDDEPGMRALMELELSSLGHRVITAVDGLEALQIVERTEVDLVITDVRMPGANGIEVLRAAKQARAPTEVIISTAYADVECAVHCLREGAADLLQKPFDLSVLHRAVERALSRKSNRATTSLSEVVRQIAAPTHRSLVEGIAEVIRHAAAADDVVLVTVGATGALHVAHRASSSRRSLSDAEVVALAARVVTGASARATPALLPQALTDDARFDGVTLPPVVAALALVPLVHGGRVLGAMVLCREASARLFERGELQVLGILAAPATLALANELLMQQLVTQERMAAIGQLSAGIAHEIRNPLMFITNNLVHARATASAARERPQIGSAVRADLEEIEQTLEDMDEGAQRLGEIVADMQGLARDGAAERLFDVGEAVRAACRVVGATVRANAILLIEQQLEAPIIGKPSQLVQVLMNLLVNAAHAIDDTGRKDGKISLQVRRSGERVVIEVIDNGAGISASNLKRIAQPFFTTKAEGKGSGLGLAISKELVERHGGELRVTSELGRGSTFTIVLPLAGTRGGRASAVRVGPQRLLLVDDEATIRRSFQRLMKRNFQVELAADGESALELVSHDQRFDVIVSDVAMPNMSGPALYREIKRRWPHLAARMLFLTGAVLEPNDLSYLQEEGVPVVHKPIDYPTLHALLVRVAGGRAA